MSDYISREAAKKILSMMLTDNAAECACNLVDCVFPADVEPVRHGRWMHEETEGGFHIWSCSRCGRGMNGNPKGTDLYCYHCGAKMDLEDKTDDGTAT